MLKQQPLSSIISIHVNGSKVRLQSFDQDGKQINISRWTEEDGYALHSSQTSITRTAFEEINILVGMKSFRPYITRDKTSRVGYKGYVVDLLETMREKLGIEYAFTKSFDGKYGTRINGSWNGLVRMLLEDRIDAVAALAMTPDRMDGK